VVITDPLNLSQYPAGRGIFVKVSASGEGGLLSTELWINGTLAGVQAAPPGEPTSLKTIFNWTPPQGGQFSLVARTLDDRGHTASSSAVIVFVDAADYGEGPDPEAGKEQPVVLPAPSGGWSPPAPPEEGEADPSDGWQGSPLDWLTDLTAQSAPAAPVLAAEADGCIARLYIQDLSDNEEGFTIYRQVTNDVAWVHVSDLASHAGQGWIEYQQQNLAGGITYYVAAFNGKGSAASNLALVNLDPEDCAPEPEEKLKVLTLKVENLELGNVDRSYCYHTLNGKNWSRFPESGFLTPDKAGSDANLLSDPLVVTDFEGQLIYETMDLKLECWGWSGGLLNYLGTLEEKLNLLDPITVHADFEGFVFDIYADIYLGFNAPTFKLEETLEPWMATYADPYSIETIGVPTWAMLPTAGVYITTDPAGCELGILEPSYDVILCQPLEGFNYGPGGVNPQRYLVWVVMDWWCKDNPQEAQPGECVRLAWWKNFAKAHDGTLGYRIYANYMIPGSSNDFNEYQDYKLMSWRIPPCDAEVAVYRVTLEVQFEDDYTRFHRLEGPAYGVPSFCGEALGDWINMQVDFNTLTLNSVDDGSGDDIADWVYGPMDVFPTGNPHHIKFPGGALCEDSAQGLIGCFLLTNGVYDLHSLFSPPFWPPVIHVPIQENQIMQISIHLIEHDDLSADDTICLTHVFIGPRTIEQWAAVENEVVYLHMPFNGNAECTLEVILNAEWTPPNP
jgi:hypothetical protein